MYACGFHGTCASPIDSMRELRCDVGVLSAPAMLDKADPDFGEAIEDEHGELKRGYRSGGNGGDVHAVYVGGEGGLKELLDDTYRYPQCPSKPRRARTQIDLPERKTKYGKTHSSEFKQEIQAHVQMIHRPVSWYITIQSEE